MTRKAAAKPKRDSLKGKPGEGVRIEVSLRHVASPEAEQRLQAALELLLDEVLSPNEILPTNDTTKQYHSHDGDGK